MLNLESFCGHSRTPSLRKFTGSFGIQYVDYGEEGVVVQIILFLGIGGLIEALGVKKTNECKRGERTFGSRVILCLRCQANPESKLDLPFRLLPTLQRR